MGAMERRRVELVCFGNDCNASSRIAGEPVTVVEDAQNGNHGNGVHVDNDVHSAGGRRLSARAGVRARSRLGTAIAW